MSQCGHGHGHVLSVDLLRRVVDSGVVGVVVVVIVAVVVHAIIRIMVCSGRIVADGGVV